MTFGHLLVVVLDMHTRLHGGFQSSLLEVIVVLAQPAENMPLQPTRTGGFRPYVQWPVGEARRLRYVDSTVPLVVE